MKMVYILFLYILTSTRRSKNKRNISLIHIFYVQGKIDKNKIIIQEVKFLQSSFVFAPVGKTIKEEKLTFK